MPEELCKELSWDSEFFGLRVARYSSDQLTAESASAVLEIGRSQGIDCVYLLLSDDPANAAAADQLGFQYVDTRLLLTLPLAGRAERPPSRKIRPAVNGDVAALQEIARKAHTDSRFYADEHFDRSRCDALYETWIERSCAGWADQALVAEYDGQPAGYITCNLSRDGVGSIGLFAVADQARGKGLGNELIGSALAWFRTAGMHTVTVVTQERNLGALRAYERHGFSIQSRQLWYHCWPNATVHPRSGYRIPFNQPGIFGNEYSYMADAVARGHISGDGAYTRRCQNLLESQLGVPRVLLTTSCTHALEMSALLLDIQPGDEIIVPSFTFVSTANAFALRGATPVFADIRPDTLNIDEQSVEALITPRTRALVAVHYAGIGCDMNVLGAIARRHGIALVEDNAHGLFGRFRGRALGTFGCLATQSFHETKNIHCGEGGALLINDPALIRRAEILREKGTNRSAFFRGEVDKYTWVDLGSSYVISDSLAAFLFAQLEARTSIQNARKRIWNLYAERLGAWAMANGVKLPYVPAECQQSYHMFYLVMPSAEARQSLIGHLKNRGILSVFHYVPLHASPMGQRFGGRAGQCPVAERVSDTLLRLPFYAGLSEEAQQEVIGVVQSFRVSAETGTPAQPSPRTVAEIGIDLVPAGLANLAQACEDPAESHTPSPVDK